MSPSGQTVAEELDVAFERVKVFMADTRTSVNQGGASGSTGIQNGGKQMRATSAEACRVPVEWRRRSSICGPINYRTDDPATPRAILRKRVTYAELIGGRHFNVELEWNKAIGNALYAPGKATPKIPKEYKIVGKPIRRADIAPKAFCTEPFVTDVKRPGMVHARMVRPPVAGATIQSIDESSIKNIPGARVVRENNFLAVVADKEWDAVKALQQLKVQWSSSKPPFIDQAALYEHIRKAPVRKREDSKPVGNVAEAFKTAARVIEAEYEWPFQSDACMGPACAVVEIAADGHVTCWSGTQKPHFLRDGIARTLGVKAETVDCIWVVGPGSYGRSDADDCGNDCAVIAKAVGKPVRLQYMRNEGTGWDPKGPASIHRARAAIDANGQVIGYEFLSKGLSRVDVNTNGSQPRDTLAGHFRGAELRSGDNFGMPVDAYAFADNTPPGKRSRPCSTRLAAAQLPPARSGRPADPLRQRSPSWTKSPTRLPSIPWSSACGTSRTRAMPRCSRRRRRRPAGSRGRRRTKARAATRERPRHRLCGAQRHHRCDRGRGRGRPHDREDLGAEVHGRA